MTSTRNEILHRAVELFNTHGYSAVSMRDIAASMDRSVGNVTYHFRRKSDLVYAIMEMQYEEYRGIGWESNLNLAGFFEQLDKMLRHQRRYFFYFNDMVDICRTYPEVRQMNEKVKSEFRNFFTLALENLNRQGIIAPPPSPDYYGQLALGMLMILMSWIQQSSVDNTDPHQGLMEVIVSILYGSLTDEGRALLC